MMTAGRHEWLVILGGGKGEQEEEDITVPSGCHPSVASQMLQDDVRPEDAAVAVGTVHCSTGEQLSCGDTWTAWSGLPHLGKCARHRLLV